MSRRTSGYLSGRQPTGSDDVQLTKLSTEGAEEFVRRYYRALEIARSTVASFYVPQSSISGEIHLPTVVFNGSDVGDGATVQEIFETQMGPAKYDLQSIDCQVINPQYQPVEQTTFSRTSTSCISMVVLTSGVVRFGNKGDDKEQGFSETFVLVSNPTAQRGGGHVRSGPGTKDFLIQTQNFRIIS